MGVIGHDIHVVSNRVIEISLQEFGYQVCNLGVNNSPDNFIDAVIEFEAAAVIISSLNGEARYWCKNIGKIFSKKNKSEVIKYLGGNLVVGDQPIKEIENEFINYGFDRVFHRPSKLEILFESLKKDL